MVGGGEMQYKKKGKSASMVLHLSRNWCNAVYSNRVHPSGALLLNDNDLLGVEKSHFTSWPIYGSIPSRTDSLQILRLRCPKHERRKDPYNVHNPHTPMETGLYPSIRVLQIRDLAVSVACHLSFRTALGCHSRDSLWKLLSPSSSPGKVEGDPVLRNLAHHISRTVQQASPKRCRLLQPWRLRWLHMEHLGGMSRLAMQLFPARSQLHSTRH